MRIFACSERAGGTICKPCYLRAAGASPNGRHPNKQLRAWLDKYGHAQECVDAWVDKKDAILIG